MAGTAHEHRTAATDALAPRLRLRHQRAGRRARAGYACGIRASQGQAQAQAPAAARPGQPELTGLGWSILPDDSVLIRVARSDMGQGIFTLAADAGGGGTRVQLGPCAARIRAGG